VRIKVELHPRVDRFIRHRCSAEEQDAFYRALERIRSAPIRHSEAIADAQLSRYMLRFFRFGSNLAIFSVNRARDVIRVCECRKCPPQRRANGGRNGG